jgi:hypothetical protein
MAKKTSASLAELKKELDRVFSIYIRIRDKGVCISCGDEKYWKYQHCGHYVSRSYLSLRFDEKNCNVQCISCNIFKKGNMDEYAIALIRKYGKNILEDLNRRKHTSTKFSKQDYERMIALYKRKAKQLESRIFI